ncbi:MAG: T9SS type A sorting domain-containing protein [Saprospiraceae bacterium]|nr:T9SS type A sorting domain-containing protein [Saprospiraceae bacterium]
MPGINSDYSFCEFPPASPFPPFDDPYPTVALRESKFGEIVREEIEWATLAEEFDYSCDEYVWGEFNADENWINLGTAEDTIYQNFYNYIFESNIDEFQEIRDLINSGDLDGALMENSNIIPENTYELNPQFVNNIYLDHIANFEEIPEESLQTLWQIASLTPWIGGPAVYTARIIIGFDPDEHGLPYRFANPDSTDKKVYSAKLFPNPASNQLEIEFNTYAGEFNISFYNILGEEIFAKEIIANSNKFVLNLDKIKTGIYFVNITKNKEVICKEKIVVIK